MEHTYELVITIDRLWEVARENLGKPFAFDTESTGLDFLRDKLIGFSFYFEDGQSFYCVMSHSVSESEEKVYLTLEEVRPVLQLLLGQGIVGCAHNLKHDLKFLHTAGIKTNTKWADTLLAAQLLDENRRNGLKQLAHLVDVDHSSYASLFTYNTWGKYHPYNTKLEDFYVYACKDVETTWKLYELFSKQLAKERFRGKSLQDVFHNLWMPLLYVLCEMEERGFKVNVDEAKRLYEQYSKDILAYEREVRIEGLNMLLHLLNEEGVSPEDLPQYYWKIVDDDDEIYLNEHDQPVIDIEGLQTPIYLKTPRSKPRKLDFNIGSNNQLVDLVYRRDLGLPEYVRLNVTKAGNDSVDVENLTIISYYLGERTPSYVKTVLEWRKLSKFVGTYLKVFIEDTDEEGALHALFNMAVSERGGGGTATGRLSSSSPNLQNIPSRGDIGVQARKLFIPRGGYKLVVADFGNMETVLMAHYSGDPELTKAFSEGLDVHAITACGQHGLEYEHFIHEYKNGNREYDKMRRVAKTTMFGSSYGMGPIKFQRMLLVQNGQEFTIDETRNILDSFNRTYQGLTDWKERVKMYVRQSGFVVTMAGRKRHLPEALSSDRTIRGRAERQAVNSVVQGSCADILFEAMIHVQSFMKSLGGGLVASVHDELVAEVPEEHAEFAAKMLGELMVGFVNPKLNVKLTADGGYGDTWYDAKSG